MKADLLTNNTDREVTVKEEVEKEVGALKVETIVKETPTDGTEIAEVENTAEEETTVETEEEIIVETDKTREKTSNIPMKMLILSSKK